MTFLIALALAATQQPGPPQPETIAPGLPPVTSWHVVEIDGKATPLTGDRRRDDRYAIVLYPGALAGYGGCNRFSGRFVKSGDEIRVHSTGSTEISCAEPMMSLEQRLFAILATPLKVSLTTPRTLKLSGPGGSVRLERMKD